MGSQERRRKRAIRVWVSETEKSEIENRACQAGLSYSQYLRVLGLGHQPKSQVDVDAVLAICDVNADLGRLGGLLKLWLRDKPNEGAPTYEVSELLDEINLTRKRLYERVEQL